MIKMRVKVPILAAVSYLFYRTSKFVWWLSICCTRKLFFKDTRMYSISLIVPPSLNKDQEGYISGGYCCLKCFGPVRV